MDRCFLLLKHRSESERIESHVLGITNSEMIHFKLETGTGRNYPEKILFCRRKFYNGASFYFVFLQVYIHTHVYRRGIFTFSYIFYLPVRMKCG
jgi:hypothetical protein